MGSSSSQTRPRIHISWKRHFTRTVNGVIKPIGLNMRAESFRTLPLVFSLLATASSNAVRSKMKSSVLVLHTKPSTFSTDPCISVFSASSLTVVFHFSFNPAQLVVHLQRSMPAADNLLCSSSYGESICNITCT